MKKMKRIAFTGMLLLGIFLMGCGKSKTVEAGTYYSEMATNIAYAPTLSVFEDNTYQMNLGMGSYFKGTYKVEDDQVTLTLEDNASNLADEDIDDITFTINDEDTLVINCDIPMYVDDGTEFNR